MIFQPNSREKDDFPLPFLRSALISSRKWDRGHGNYQKLMEIILLKFNIALEKRPNPKGKDRRPTIIFQLLNFFQPTVTWINGGCDQTLTILYHQLPYRDLLKHLLRRYLDPQNVSKTPASPAEEVFGCLGN